MCCRIPHREKYAYLCAVTFDCRLIVAHCRCEDSTTTDGARIEGPIVLTSSFTSFRTKFGAVYEREDEYSSTCTKPTRVEQPRSTDTRNRSGDPHGRLGALRACIDRVASGATFLRTRLLEVQARTRWRRRAVP